MAEKKWKIPDVEALGVEVDELLNLQLGVWLIPQLKFQLGSVKGWEAPTNTPSEEAMDAATTTSLDQPSLTGVNTLCYVLNRKWKEVFSLFPCWPQFINLLILWVSSSFYNLIFVCVSWIFFVPFFLRSLILWLICNMVGW